MSDRVKAFFYGNYDVECAHKSLKDEWSQREFADFLDQMLENHDTLFGPKASRDFDRDALETFNTNARSLAKKYVDKPIWHTPSLTNYLLDEVLEGQCTYLVWSADWGIYPAWSLRHSLPSPYRKFVSPLLGLALFILYSGLLYWLWGKDYIIASALLALFMIYTYLIEGPWILWRRHRQRTQFMRLAQLLVIPLYEIRSGNYDPGTISRRLQACEQKDLQVASVAFALLKLLMSSSGQHVPSPSPTI